MFPLFWNHSGENLRPGPFPATISLWRDQKIPRNTMFCSHQIWGKPSAGPPHGDESPAPVLEIHKNKRFLHVSLFAQAPSRADPDDRAGVDGLDLQLCACTLNKKKEWTLKFRYPVRIRCHNGTGRCHDNEELVPNRGCKRPM